MAKTGKPKSWHRERPAEREKLPHPALSYSPPRSVIALRIGGWLAGMVVLAAAAYAGYWLFAAHQLRAATLAWATARQAHGDEIRLGEPALAGFPGIIRIEVEQPLVRTRLFGEAMAWQAERLAVTMNPFTPGRLVLRSGGPQEVTIRQGGAARRYAGTVARLEAPLRVVGASVPEAAVELVGLRLSAGPGDEVAVAEVRGRFQQDSATAATLNVEARGASLPRTLALPLGNEIAQAALQAEWRGPLAAPPWAESLRIWRDAGGTVEIRRLSGEYGPLSLDADGTLSLDREMQPIGAMSGQVGGLFEAIDRLRDSGYVRSRDATTVKLVLATLARRDPATGRSLVNVPLTLQDRTLSLGPVRVLEIPAVRWPGDAGRGESG